MTELADRLAALIAAEGPIGVDVFMGEANAHYYATRDPLGRGGDFTTAPEIHQMFGELIGAALADLWDRAGRPPDAVYAELGPGRGTLANDALRVLRRIGFGGGVHLVETSPVLRAAQKQLIPDAQFHDGIGGLPPCPLLLIANEFFDALPVRQWVGSNERRIAHGESGFSFTRDGEIWEESPARSAAAEQLARHLSSYGGVALVIDYGHAEGGTGDTLQAVKRHAFAHPLEAPGEQDLTAHVDFAALADSARRGGAVASRAISQGSWLETIGIGARAMALAAKNPQDTEGIASARRRLCDEEEMGRLFKVMALRAPGWPDVAGLAS